jgi:Tfp pilus assembly protein PilO
MMQLAKLIRRYRELCISIGMIAICILGVVFGIIPGIGKIVQMRNDIVALSNTVEQLKTRISVVNSNDESVYRIQLQELVAAVPSDKSLTTLFSTVDALAGASGVTIADLSLTKPGSIATESAKKQSNEEKQIGSNILPFSVTVNGGYQQIYSFLSQVVNVRRFFRVRNFDISFVDTSNISVRMGMDAFYSPIVLNPVAFDKPLEPLTAEEQTFIAKIQAMPIVGALSLPPPTVGGTPTETSRTDPFSP